MAVMKPYNNIDVEARCPACFSPFLTCNQNPSTLRMRISCTSCHYKGDEDDFNIGGLSKSSFTMDSIHEAKRKMDDIMRKTERYSFDMIDRSQLPRVCRRCGMSGRMSFTGPAHPGPNSMPDHMMLRLAHCESCGYETKVEVRVGKKQSNEYILTIIMKNGEIIHHKHRYDNELPPWIKFHVPRPEKLRDPRMHWDDHLSGIDLTVDIFKANHFSGTVYMEE